MLFILIELVRICAVAASCLFNQVNPAEWLSIASIWALLTKNIHEKDEMKSNYVCS